MLTPQKASEIAGVSRKTIMNHITDGTLKARRSNENKWQIDPKDLHDWMDARKPQISVTTSGMPVAGTEENLISIKDVAQLVALEVSKREVASLKARVTALEQELKEAKAETKDVLKDYRELALKLIEVLRDKRPKKPKPLVLTNRYRVKPLP